MLINSVTLKNIKSYKDATKYEPVEFQEGINGIFGKNGDGKTTILEAIGYAMFDYLPYKQEAFIRHGEKSGEIKIQGIGKDEVEFTILRKVGTSKYEVHLPTRVIKGKEDVLYWVKNNLLGEVVDQSEIPAQFRDMIGVPQGTFTAIFSESPEPRKTKFNKILRVNEYKTAFDNLKPVLNLVEKNINNISQEINLRKVRAEPETKIKNDLESSKRKLTGDINELENKKQKEEKLKTRKKELELHEREIQNLARALEILQTKWDTSSEQFKDVEKQLIELSQAQQTLNETERGYHEYIDANEHIKQLRDKEKEKEKIKERLQNIETNLVKVNENIKNIQTELGEINNAKQKVAKLLPKVEKQESLEKEIPDMREKLVRLKLLRKQVKDDKKELDGLNEKIQKIENELVDYDTLKTEVETIPDLETAKENLHKTIANFNADIRKYRENRKATEGGICPFLEQECPVVKGNLGTYFEKKIENVQKELEKPVSKIGEVNKKLEHAKESHDRFQELGHKKASLPEYAIRKSKLEKNIVENQRYILELEDYEKRLPLLERELKELSDPKSEYHHCQHVIKNEDGYNTQLHSLREKAKEYTVTREETKINLKRFKDIDDQITELDAKLERLRPEHDEYIISKSKVKDLKDIPEKHKNLQLELDNIKREIDRRKVEHDKKSAEFSPKELEKIQDEYIKLGKNISSIESQVKMLRESINHQNQELKRIEKVKQEIKVLEEKNHEEGELYRFVRFIRETLKKSAELIVLELINSISREANNIYCELMGDYTSELKWSQNYDIMVTENAEDKSFKQLSGGEQMASALAVRLALLKILSATDIVFLDEPTQNMDELRRANLAQQIQNIKGFKQIFIISHDDTFSAEYQNVIRLEKIHGESKIIAR